MQFTKSGHAVVIGGSMAGILAARVLADHFETVTLIERDRARGGARFPSRRAAGSTCARFVAARAANDVATLSRKRIAP